MTSTPDKIIADQVEAYRVFVEMQVKTNDAFATALTEGLRARGIEWSAMAPADMAMVVRLITESNDELAAASEAAGQAARREMQEKLITAGIVVFREHGQTIAARVAAVLRPGSAS